MHVLNQMTHIWPWWNTGSYYQGTKGSCLIASEMRFLNLLSHCLCCLQDQAQRHLPLVALQDHQFHTLFQTTTLLITIFWALCPMFLAPYSFGNGCPDETLLLSDMSNIPELHPVNLTESSYNPFPNSTLQIGTGMEGYRNYWEASMIWSLSLLIQSLVQKDSVEPDSHGAGDQQWTCKLAGWRCRLDVYPITISVPYQSCQGTPLDASSGPKNYTINDFYHQKLVSVIRERILGLGSNHQFHFSPYEMHQ